MGPAGLFTGIAGGIFEMAGTYQGSRSTQMALQNQARQAEANANMALLEAEAEASMQVIQAKKLIAEQGADFAASGLSGGSAMAVMFDSMVNAEMDRLNILYAGDVRSKNFMAEARQKKAEAKAIRQGEPYQLAASGFKMASQTYGRR